MKKTDAKGRQAGFVRQDYGLCVGIRGRVYLVMRVARFFLVIFNYKALILINHYIHKA